MCVVFTVCSDTDSEEVPEGCSTSYFKVIGGGDGDSEWDYMSFNFQAYYPHKP